MAPVIWGLDLKDMQWGKFKGSYMFAPTFHLQKTKMIVYQIAMLSCVVSESVGTAALSDYVDQQDGISHRSHGRALVQNNDFIGVASYNIFIGIAVATIFGSGFFFDLFWPERHESQAVKWAWKISSIVISIMALADALAMTIIVATHRAHITGVSGAEARYWFAANGKPTPIYRKNAECVASVVLLWPGVIASFASTYIMWKSIQHNDVHGPFAAGYGSGKELPMDMPAKNTASSETGTGTGTAPASAHSMPMNGYGHAGNHGTTGPLA
ncbi:hypothetical protein LOCC1_G006298 [Lachnellula occidentalis]|uniref:Uncharacterized protein n=1 Tax=Lachnellula occidentalis TaxID=215460 RepID=A0A8H8RNW0_9HELO|nr:hypothetical protein LOCC1_G006298 [Lachnellula occidentalis]